MLRFIRKWKYIITILLVIILLFGFIYLKKYLNYKKDDITYDILEENDLVNNDFHDDSIQECYIDLKGAVINPGVYIVDCNSNVSDVIKYSGGLRDDADTSVINLAKKVADQMVIIVYTKEEVKNSNIVDTVIKTVERECVCPNIQNDACINDKITDDISNDNNDLININNATLSELQTLPGIGESKAKAIIAYRESVGKFETIDDILNVDGIGSKLYEDIKAYITT